MDSIFRSIEVNAPVAEVYGHWARVEDFPLFIQSLREVKQIAEDRFYWRAEHNGIEYESVEELSLKIPGKRIAWRNVSGSENSGLVSFEELGEMLTRVTLELAYEPGSGWHEPAALAERIDSTLQAFKDLIEPGLMEEMVLHNWQGF